MRPMASNPRSVLHALEPIGRGTGEVESLLSYFCRLAVSHSTSTLCLSRSIAARLKHELAPNYDWHERQISGLRESALTWSAALSALTTLGGLDKLTFLPWRDVIAQNGLPLVTKGQFCPACLAADKAAGRVPYFRLSWESKAVSVCHHHKTALCKHCPSCGKDNIRHAAAFVVPGWCTHCGAFLGEPPPVEDNSKAPQPSAIWQARQVGNLVEVQQTLQTPPSRDAVTTAIKHIIASMDNSNTANFAQRIGVGKSTVHHWLKGPGTPTLRISLSIASQSGIRLTDLLTGDITHWKPPASNQQLSLQLLQLPRLERASARALDWDHIERQLQCFLKLPTPISVLEAARRLGVEARQLYLRANQTTRMVGERWKDYLARRQLEHIANALPHLEAECTTILQEGKTITKRAIQARVPAEVLSRVPQLLNVLKEVQARISHSATE